MKKQTKKKSVKSKKATQKKEIKPVKKKALNLIKKVVKRSGRVVPFNQKKIEIAVLKAFSTTGEGSAKDAKLVATKVSQMLGKGKEKGYIPGIEEIQDNVEKVLMVLDFEETAKAYILYREQHRKISRTKDVCIKRVKQHTDFLVRKCTGQEKRRYYRPY